MCGRGFARSVRIPPIAVLSAPNAGIASYRGKSTYDVCMTRVSLAAIALVLINAGCSESGSRTDRESVDAAATPAADTQTPPDESTAMTETSQTAQHDDAHHVNGEHAHTNRLINSSSPYLLQHAHNPVDWYPWSEEAFEAARAQNKPIFLSVGYSTCYWCHVMERESFENEAIAAIMNELFINVKVDREERPDVDDIYMTAVQMFTQGGGGWPMSVFLEPEGLKPFFGGTYFPAESKFNRPSFPDMMRNIHDAWTNQRPQLLRQANSVADQIGQYLARPQQEKALNAGHVALTASQIMRGYDEMHGGFANPPRFAPKFPMPTHLDLLIATDWNDEVSEAAVLKTLNRMARGGMYDQVGGGFHRYSTDRIWLVPHFEKMLYDNGQLASTYAAVLEKTNDPYYAEIVRETLDYVLREMTGDGGAFYSAQDAEVDAREGLNYLWQPDQVREVLTDAEFEDDIDLVFAAYGLNEQANFQDPHHPEEPRRYILHLTKRPEKLAESLGITLEDFNTRLARANAALLAVRDTRKQPRLDDKTIVGWNGLMIAGFADGGRVLQEQRYVESAKQAAEFVLSNMRTPDGGLLRTYRNGEAKIDAFFEDYAMFTHGLLALHKATGENRWIDASIELAGTAKERFWDADHGGYFDTLADQSDLFVRTRSARDGAVPSGMSIMLNNLITLHEVTGEARFHDDAIATFKSLSATISQSPASLAVASIALHRFLQNNTADALRPSGSAGPLAVDEIVTYTFSQNDMNVDAEVGSTFEMILSIADGWHINAHEPGNESLIPLNVELVGAEGLTLAVTYPDSETFAGPVGAMQVHSRAATIRLTIRADGSVTGSPQLALTYQACDDTKCLAPQTEMIPLRWTDN